MMTRRSLLSFFAFLPFAAQAAPFTVPTLQAPEHGLNVFHLGHSLVSLEMPHMLAQLAPEAHNWHAQLGSGTSLKAHWEPDIEILDFDTTNATPRFRAARDAIGSGDYDAVVLTEMVELRDAIRYFNSARYMRRWANLARGGNAQTRIYLYETWHNLDDPTGWLERIDHDLEKLWLRQVLGSDSRRNPDHPVYLIPAGQVMAAVVRAAESGQIDGLTRRDQLFERKADGSLDTIHINDLGRYIVTLTHYSVLYHRSPVGRPHLLKRKDGTEADAFSETAAQQIQQIVWHVVKTTQRTGLDPQKES
ncbi:hypothetical protein SAMN04488118_101347 [Epibacterium ulvae]|uniref:Uncharacterized protein n=2 Tax=Epibacterium ulvae TaxID=1156985 RepID=A0A1G5PNP3_9RHOB|nr:hypothetical protein [Epibacterium ulvae]SCZ50740.1 hypothetical protein SAMN04488118_101347 [Epibacterium ulvae]